MNVTLKTLSIVLAAALATPALAQDQAKPAEGTTEQTQAPVSDQVLDLGQPSDGPALGDRYSKEKMDDWDLACVKTEAETDPCSMVQLLKDQRGTDMAEFSLFRIEGQGQAVAGATVIVPLETLLPAQLNISVDGAPGKRYNYAFCNQFGCVAQIGLTQADIDAYRKGKVATLRLVPAPAPDKVVELQLSLKGFSAAFDKVDVVKDQ